MFQHRLRTPLTISLFAVLAIFVTQVISLAQTTAKESKPSVKAQSAKAPHNHYDGKKHPTTIDPSRFVTSRQSKVVLPLPEERDAFFFVVFGDRTGGPAEGIKVLDQAVADTNLLEPDMVMTVGDMVQGYCNTEKWIPQMREFKSVMNKLLCPWFPVVGNHDIYWRGPNRPKGENESTYEMHFGPLWYAFEHKNCWFIALYSDEGNPETGEKTFNKPDSQRMSDEQFTWLKNTLEKASEAEHVFLFLHHPRWLGGGYGDDWEKVHDLLKEAGNVRIVFAGHIHQMRYDGPRDNIEYLTLATTGGSQSFAVPKAGNLHQYHIVTVRKDQIAIAAAPVGETMDVRAITGKVASETYQLSKMRPLLDAIPRIGKDGAPYKPVKIKLTNPVQSPIEVTMMIDSDDSRWYGSPDHIHLVIKPGETKWFNFSLSRITPGFDEAYRHAEIVMLMDYLGEGIRIPIPESRMEIPLRIDLPAPTVPTSDLALSLDGDDSLKIPTAMLKLPDGPLTLECWFKANSYGDRTGLITKTERSEYGLFVSNGCPEFCLLLNNSYVRAYVSDPILSRDVWTHIAGVYDGANICLYVDGRLVSSVKGKGARRTNNLPLMIGADVDKKGKAVSNFEGMIDAVRLSSIARYDGKLFKPSRRPESDSKTLLLLNMDAQIGPWIYDASPSAAHAQLQGDPGLVEAK